MKKRYDRSVYAAMLAYAYKEEYEKIKRCAEKNGESINHMINRLIQAEIERHTGEKISIPETGTTRGPAKKYETE